MDYWLLVNSKLSTIKKHITGKSNATKYAVLNAIKQKGFEPKDDKEADSLAIMEKNSL